MLVTDRLAVGAFLTEPPEASQGRKGSGSTTRREERQENPGSVSMCSESHEPDTPSGSASVIDQWGQDEAGRNAQRDTLCS
jgi:hypothetical protein